MSIMPPKWPEPAQKRRRGGKVERTLRLRRRVTRAHHEIGPRATGPAGRLVPRGGFMPQMPPIWPEPAQKRRRGGSVERALWLRRRGTLLNWEWARVRTTR